MQIADYFKAGRLADAAKASALALGTGARDRELLYHAAAIKHAQGDDRSARLPVARALDGNPHFDVVRRPRHKRSATSWPLDRLEASAKGLLVVISSNHEPSRDDASECRSGARARRGRAGSRA